MAESAGTVKSGWTIRAWLFTVFVSLVVAVAAQAQEAPASQTAAPDEHKAQQKKESEESVGGTPAKQEPGAEGEEHGEEEYSDLKHAWPIQWIANKTGLSVHGAHMLALSINFAVIVVLVYLATRKSVPARWRARSASIQQALEEARAASRDANQRLAEIEKRLRQLDVEIGQMQGSADKEAEAEETRIKGATEEDIHKVVETAKQEIAAAEKLARRELNVHTASLAVALARQQIRVDVNTDQVLVRSFAGKLADDGKDGGKDGR
jgi:F-type H+-transporting ATPase subunit b